MWSVFRRQTKKRFIVAFDSLSRRQTVEFEAYADSNEIQIKYLTDNVWLLATVSDITAKELRDDLRKLYPDVWRMVFELYESGYTWAGSSPKGQANDIFEWLHENWGRE